MGAVVPLQTKADLENEDQVSRYIEERWGCELRPFPTFSPIDRFAVRGHGIIGVLELKCRSYVMNQPFVLLNFSKWRALFFTAIGLKCRPLFVNAHPDGSIYWIDIEHVDPSRQRVCGSDRPGRNGRDIEPAIEIPLKTMKRIR